MANTMSGDSYDCSSEINDLVIQVTKSLSDLPDDTFIDYGIFQHIRFLNSAMASFFSRAFPILSASVRESSS